MKNKTGFKVLLCAAFILIAGPVAFAQYYVATALLNLLGLFCFLTAARLAEPGREVRMTYIVFAAASVIRFMFVFGCGSLYIVLVVIFVLLTTGVAVIGMQLDRKLVIDKQMIWGLAVFPLVYTLNLYLAVSLHLSDFFNLSTLPQLLPVVSMNLRWAGEYGMVCITVLFVSLLSMAFVSKKGREKALCAVLAVCIAAGLFVSGKSIEKAIDEPDTVLHVAVATCAEEPFDGNTIDMYSKEERFELFESALKQAKDGDAKLLMLNEEYYSINKEDLKTIKDKISAKIAEYGIPVLMMYNIPDVNSDKYLNQAVFYDEKGNEIYSYIKRTLVPIVEKGEYVEGTEDPQIFVYSFNGKMINTSVVICFDINNDPLLSRISDDTELLLVPSWDWDRNNVEQMRTCARSVEIGATILKHTYDGFSYASGPKGLCGDFVDFRGRFGEVDFIDVPIWKKTE